MNEFDCDLEMKQAIAVASFGGREGEPRPAKFFFIEKQLVQTQASSESRVQWRNLGGGAGGPWPLYVFAKKIIIH